MRRTFSLAAALIAVAVLAGCPPHEKCSGDQIECFGNCVDAQTDPTACGPGCVRCPTGGSCVAGGCECPAGQTACGGACVDTQTNAANCGACGQSCGLGTCAGGVCDCTGHDDCAPAFPQCVDTATDPLNCGACGAACPTLATCSAPDCLCPAGAPDVCGTNPGKCVNLATDEANCGACGAACPTGATCTATVCECPPLTPEICGTAPGRCVDQDKDPTACGASCQICPTNGVCTTGVCGCPDTLPSLCPGTPGTCVDLTSDPDHCGTCATACTGTQVCTTGKCCLATQTVCGSTVKNCCDGTGCCGDSCQTKHSNGLDGFFFDCNPLRTYSLASAVAAANAWTTGGSDSFQFCSGSCLARQTATQCAVWCYEGNFIGEVSLNADSPVCTCPPGGTSAETWD